MRKKADAVYFRKYYKEFCLLGYTAVWCGEINDISEEYIDSIFRVER
jgi:hypothetical protein